MHPPSGRSIQAWSAFTFLFFLVLLASHWTVLTLPYFWDELGQFIPAALDILRDGAWVPKSTLPNVHPPGVMAWLALVWKITGYSILATRVAMLALAAVGVLAVFLLAIELCRDVEGAPALIAPLLLLCSPLFWSQSMLAQLDMPAMVFTALSLLFFLKNRIALCAVVCTALVLCKESSIVVPFVFGCVLLKERRILSALLFFTPAVALGVWLYILYSATGHIFGNGEFTHYNVAFQWHPIRLPVTFLRRFFYLFIDNFHWIGTIVILIALRRTAIFQTRAWTVIALVAALQTTVVSVLGGAALERYLMPVLPLFYVAVAAAMSTLLTRVRLVSTLVMAGGLVAAIVINSPFTYPYENNAAFVSFVRLQQRAAKYVATVLPGRTVVSAWPFPDSLRRPEFGYVDKPVAVRGIENFDRATVLALAGQIDVLVVYSRTWESKWGVLQAPWIRRFLGAYYFYQPQIGPGEIQQELGLSPVARWEDNGQWIEIYIRARTPDLLIL